jgi:hypothetical protein
MFDTGDTWMMASSPVPAWSLTSNLRTIYAMLAVILQLWQTMLVC